RIRRPAPVLGGLRKRLRPGTHVLLPHALVRAFGVDLMPGGGVLLPRALFRTSGIGLMPGGRVLLPRLACGGIGVCPARAFVRVRPPCGSGARLVPGPLRIPGPFGTLDLIPRISAGPALPRDI